MASSQPKFNYMDTLPLLAEPYLNACLEYIPFLTAQRLKTGITWQYGLELEDQGTTVVTSLFTQLLNDSLRYGSPNELLEQVKLFMDFPGNHDYFFCNASQHYFNKLKFYTTHGDAEKKFICKNDLFLYLQNKLASKEEFMICRLPLAMLTYFLKSQEKRLEGTSEFVHFDPESIRTLEKELIQLAVDMRRSACSLPEMGHNAKKIFQQYRKLLPVEMPDDDLKVLSGILKEMLVLNRQLTRVEAEKTAAQFYNFAAIFIPRLQKMMTDRPQWFLTEKRMPAKLRPSKPVIRLFVDQNTSFIFSRDLAKALKSLSAISEEWKDDTEIVDTVDLETAEKICNLYGFGIDRIELIEIAVLRAKHAAVPIPSGTGVFCNLSADVFIQLFREQLFGTHVFENVTPDHSRILMNALNDLSYVFNPDVNSIYLINRTMQIDITLKMMQNGVIKTPFKSIRKVSGFTSEDVKKELKHLGVDSFFKDVCTFADVTHQNLMTKKKVLRTCDMYDAIENCIMLSVCRMFPKFAAFLHNQSACYRIPGLECSKCSSPIQSAQNIPSFFSAPFPTVTPKPQITKQKLGAALTMTTTKRDGTQHVYVPGSTLGDTVAAASSAPLPTKKVEKSCENCLKTSEKCQKAAENLQSSQKSETNLEKELSGLKTKMMQKTRNEKDLEKDYMEKMAILEKKLDEKRQKRTENMEKLEELERKLAAQNLELQKAQNENSTEIENLESEFKNEQEKLQTTNFRLSTQNEDKEAMIQKLAAKLSGISK